MSSMWVHVNGRWTVVTHHADCVGCGDYASEIQRMRTDVCKQIGPDCMGSRDPVNGVIWLVWMQADRSRLYGQP